MSNSNRNTKIYSKRISDTSQRSSGKYKTDTIDPNRLRELKNINSTSSSDFSPNTVGYIDQEEFERMYSNELEASYQDKTRGKSSVNSRTGETLSTGRTSTRNGKGTGVINDSKIGKWILALITIIVIFALFWFYTQNDESKNALKNSLASNLNSNNTSVENSSGEIGTVGSDNSGYYNENGDREVNDTIHSGDGRAFDSNTLADHISSDAFSANYIYVIGESDGKLAVFLEGEATPLEVYDTYIGELPEADQSYIKKGIRVTSVAELAEYLEDLTS